jgi:hypothetical protein
LKEIFYPKTIATKTFSENETFRRFWLMQKIKLNISVSKLDEAVERKNHNTQAVNPVESAETDEALPPSDGLSAVFVTIAQVIPGHQAQGGEVVIDIDRHPTFGSSLVDFPTNIEEGDQLVFPEELIAQSRGPPMTEQPEKHFRELFEEQLTKDTDEHLSEQLEEQMTKDPKEHLSVQPEEQMTKGPEAHLPVLSEEQLTKDPEEHLTVQSEAQLTKELEELEEHFTEQSEEQLKEQSVEKFTSDSEDQLTELSKGQFLELSEKQLTEQCEEHLPEQPEELWVEHRTQTLSKPEELVTEQSEEQTAEQREELLTEQPEKPWTEHSEQSQEPDQLDKHLPKQPGKKLVEESKHLSQSQAGEAKHMPWEIVCKGDVCSLVKLRKN